MAKIDAVLQELDGGVYDIQIDDFGDIRTADFFDTSIFVSILSDKRANEGEVPDSKRRRGWIGNEVRDDGFEIGSKLWLFEQSRLTRTVMNGIEDAVRDALQWMVNDGIAAAIQNVRVAFAPPSSPIIGVLVTADILRPQGEVETRFFDLWTNTGISAATAAPPFESIIPEAPFSPQLVSVDFDGTSAEELGSATGVPLEIANVFTAAIWWKPRAANYSPPSGFSTNVWGIREEDGETLQNRLSLALLGSTANEPAQVALIDSAGDVFKRYRYDSVTTQDEWNFSLFTWDGSSLIFYHDGSLIAPTSTPVDDAGVGMTDTDRIIRMAQADGITDGLDGLIYSIGLWNLVVDSPGQASLFNLGIGSAVDWKQNFGSYTFGSNLKHWWRTGNDPDDIGRDYGRASVLIDAAEAAVGITAADIMTDSPS